MKPKCCSCDITNNNHNFSLNSITITLGDLKQPTLFYEANMLLSIHKQTNFFLDFTFELCLVRRGNSVLFWEEKKYL